MEHLQSTIIALVDHFGYLGLFIGMALGNIGAPIGSEIVLPVAGALTATGHLPFLWATIGVSVIGELAGGSVGYAVGRFGGRPLIDNYGKYVHLHHENLNRVHAFFEKYGNFAIFICRFVPVVRGIVSIPAGLAEMDLAPFYFWYFLGSLGFCGGLILLGNAFGSHLDAMLPLLHRSGLIVLTIAVIATAAIWIGVRTHRAR
ncbi:MAG TPA: DedA family protein [Candidatus Baltobacteraceae bacterium]|jgi:membrane protein DedA with SNARE-associated domain|nr:DedA family protein [Candidatus Baltobacteraceae bacterium]